MHIIIIELNKNKSNIESKCSAMSWNQLARLEVADGNVKLRKQWPNCNTYFNEDTLT